MSAYVKTGGEIAIDAADGRMPEITVLTDGRFVVVWSEDPTGSYNSAVWTRIFAADGTPLGNALQLAGSLYSAHQPTVTALAGGGFVAIWGRGAPDMVDARICDANGVPTGPVFTIPGDSGMQVTALNDGGFAVAWGTNQTLGGDTSGSSVHLRTYSATGAAVSGDILVNTTTAGGQDAPFIDTLAGGGLVVTWSDDGGTTDAGDDKIMAQVFDASGAKVGVELTVSASARLWSWNSPVTALANGGFAVSWVMANDPVYGGSGGIWTQVYTAAGVAVGGPMIMPHFPDSATIDLTVLADGSIAIVWSSHTAPNFDGSADGVFVQVFGADGAPLTPEVLVNTQTIGYQSDPSIVARDDGGFMVSWTDSRGTTDATDDQIKVQIFGPTDAWTPVVIGSNGGGATATVAIDENTTAVTTVVASGGEAALTYAIAGGADAAKFAIDAATGVLRFVAAPNFESRSDVGSNNVYEVLVSASDGTRIDTQALSISVLNVNEFAPVISSFGSSASLGVAENSVLVRDFDASDADQTPVTFSISGTDAARFTIDAATGVLQFVTAPNYEAPTSASGFNTYLVTVTASDGVNVDTVSLNVNVSNVNEGAPTITSLGGGDTATVTVSENLTAVATVTATDIDLTAPTFAIIGGADAARFAINATSGVLTFVAAPNFEAPTDADGNNVYEVTVRASDGSLTDSQTIAVTVADVPVAITSLGGGDTAVRTVNENTTAVTTVVATDLAPGFPAFAIAGGADAARFAINATSGALSFVAAPNFEAPTDANGNNIYEVIVSATNGTATDTQAIAVTVANVNETVVITSLGGGTTGAVTVNENGTAVTTVAAVDPDNGTVSYSISGGTDSARFTINATTGVLTFVAAPNYEAPTDSNLDNVYSVTVRASDGSTTDTQTIAVTVANLNDNLPVLTGVGTTLTLSQSENIQAVRDFDATDLDGNPLTFAVSGADAAKFTIDAVTGVLQFATAPDFEAPGSAAGSNTYSVTVTASDGVYSDQVALTVYINGINEAPVITSNGGGTSAALTVSENVSAVTTVTSTDPENTARTYSISGGADAAKFTIGASTGQLAFVSAANFEAPGDADGNNVYDVTVRVTDGSLADTQSLSITVADVNESPVITSNGGGNSAAIALDEGTIAVTTVTATDEEGSPVGYAIAGGADASRFAIDPLSGALTFLVAPDREAPADADGNNVYDVVVSATDGSVSDTQTLAVTVRNVNETLHITSGSAATVAENGTLAATVAATDIDGDAVAYAIVGGADAALFAIDAVTGEIRFGAAPDFEAPGDTGGDNVYDVEVRATDGSFVQTQALTITVADANEVPTITSNAGGGSATIALVEGETAVATVAAADPDAGQSLAYAIAGGADAALFVIDAATGLLSFATGPDFEAPADADGNNLYEVTVQASDGLLTDVQALSVAIGNRNEGLAITSNGGGETAAISVVENSALVTTVIAADMDQTAPVYAIAGGADAARFEIDAATGELRFAAIPNFEAPADADADNVYDVLVSASDGQFTETQALAVSVADAIEVTLSFVATGFDQWENYPEVVSLALDGTQEGEPVVYAITGGADAALFQLDPESGAIYLAAQDFEAPADADGDNVYEVEVSATQAGGSAIATVSFTLHDLDEAPVLVSPAEWSASENETYVGTLEAADPEGRGMTYFVVGGADGEWFQVNAETGEFGFLANPDFEAPTDADGDNVYELEIGVADDSSVVTQTIHVTVADVDDSLRFAETVFSSPENNATVATLSVLGGDPAATSYAIFGGADAALFALDASSGALQFVVAPDFEAWGDADGDNVYEVEVAATAGSTSTVETAFVMVDNVDEATTIVSGGGGATATFAVAENSTTVTTVSAYDLDNDLISYALAGGADAARFSINPATGVLRFLAAPDYEAPTDANLDNRYEVVVKAGTGALADFQAITVEVGNVNGVSLSGTAGSDVLTGTAEADVLSGLGGIDTLSGGGGSDRLIGGAGADALSGGSGDDYFVYNGVSDTGTTAGTADQIQDFSHSQGDKIDLSAIDANSRLAGNQPFVFIGSSAFAALSPSTPYGQVRAFQSGSDTIIQGDINGDRAVDFQIVLDTPTTLVSGDFIL